VAKPAANPAASSSVVCVDLQGETYEVDSSVVKWRPSAYAVVIKDNALLVSPQFGDGYDLPGGGLDIGEMPEAAVLRETKEETGLDVISPKLLGIESNLFKPPYSEGVFIQSIMLYYQCDYADGEFSMDGFDEYEKQYARMAEWLPLDKLDSIKLASSIDWRPFVRQAMAERG
jgi:8-oxo-dGTP diphosphatase